MLAKTLAGATDSWAIRFWWSVFRADGLVLFPPRSLVTNIGRDCLATNYRLGFLRQVFTSITPVLDEKAPALPARIVSMPRDREAVIRALRRAHPAMSQIVRARNLLWPSSKNG
jgi:hypothetical protein